MTLFETYNKYTTSAERWINANVVSVPKDFVKTSVKSFAGSFAVSFISSMACAENCRFNAGLKGGLFGTLTVVCNIGFRVLAWKRWWGRGIRARQAEYDISMRRITRDAFLSTVMLNRAQIHLGWSLAVTLPGYLMHNWRREFPPIFAIVYRG